MDEQLRAIQNEFVTIRFGLEAYRAGVPSVSRLCQREDNYLFAVGDAREQFSFLAFGAALLQDEITQHGR